MRNPLTQVTGPEFLFLFAVLIVAIAAICWWRQWSRDTSVELSPLSPPQKIDPYEMAYFRGGDNELARVIIIRLIELKYLRITTPAGSWWKTLPNQIERASDAPSEKNLTPIELAAFEWFRSPRTAEDVFKSSESSRVSIALPTELTYHTLKYEQKLRAERLLTSDALKEEAGRNVAVGIAVVAAIALARLFIGVSRGRPVGFLLLMAIVGGITIFASGRPARLSRRGKLYLDAARETWSSLKNSADCSDWSPSIAAALFGFTVLNGTEMSPLNDMFTRARQTGGWTGASGAGGGCGGGGCGAGCGGGCGGCGGCGG